jgi:hypothetical protein
VSLMTCDHNRPCAGQLGGSIQIVIACSLPLDADPNGSPAR